MDSTRPARRSLALDFEKVKNNNEMNKESLDIAYQTICDIKNKDFAEFWRGLTPKSTRIEVKTTPLDDESKK